MSRSVWKGDDGLHGHAKAAKRRASVQAMQVVEDLQQDLAHAPRMAPLGG
jgi:hypothetical protein